MANKATYEIEIKANLERMLSELGKAEGKLSSFMKSGNAPKGIEKSFEKVRELLGQISDQASQPMDMAGFKRAKGELDKVQQSLNAISRLVKDFDELPDKIKFEFLPEGEKKKFNEAAEAIRRYLDLVSEASKKSKELAGAEKTQSKVGARVEELTGKKTKAEGRVTKKKTELEGAKRTFEAAQGSGASPERLAKYQAEIDKLQVEYDDLVRTLKDAEDQLTSSQTEYDTASASVAKLSKELKGIETKQLNELKEQAAKMGISLEGIKGKKHAIQIEMLTAAIEKQSKAIMEEARPAYDEFRNSMDAAGAEAGDLKDKMEAGIQATKEMEEAASQQKAFEDKIKSFLGLSGAAQVLRSALRDAMSTIKELDAVMTQMSVVTDLTVGDYWDQLPEYSARASELGVSITSAYEAATLYYQQGLKTNEVTAISTETLKMAKIAGIDAAEATDKMTAALRGFNMELNEASAQKISDVYSELAAITAADVDEISTAMTKTASIASSAGMEFETTAAFLSQIIETTRESAETAGTAMKTVIARFQELKKDPSEIGEVDGEIVDANAIETALRSVGVSLRDTSGQFRELDDVFLELSSKWDGLDKNTQRYIATIAAGSRQQSRFIAMMQDYKRTTELVTAANTSAGASQRQFEKTLEGLEAKLEKLSNAWHEFTMGIMDSDIVKFGVDALTAFLEIVNKATDGINGFGGAFTKIVSVIGIFKLGMKIFQKFENPIMSLYKKVTEWAGIESFKAGKAYAEGAERGARSAMEESENQPETPDESDASEGESPKKKAGFIQKMVGLGSGTKSIFKGEVKDARKKLTELKKKRSKKAREKDLLEAEASASAIGEEASQEEKDAATARAVKAREALEEYTAAEEDLKNKSKQAWSSIGAGISAAGEAAVGAGAALSMVGGIISSLGAEELGSVISDIGQGITMVGGALMAIPPILTLITSHPIIAIITLVLAAVLAGVLAIINAMKDNSIEGRLNKAVKATEQAKEAAQEAKEAYNDLLQDRSGYDELQKTLEDLTYGTKEWKAALVEANTQVMELLSTYPELAQYLTRGEDGQLTISDEGWDSLVQSQQQKIANTTALVANKQLEEYQLKLEGAEGDFDKKALGYKKVETEDRTYYVENEELSEKLQKDLKHYILTQGEDLQHNVELADKLAKKYNTTTSALQSAQEALIENRKEIEAISQEAENIARANLTAMATDTILASEFGNQVIDTFSESLGGEHFQSEIDNTKKALSDEAKGTNILRDGETFKALANQYNLTTTGNDRTDLENLYKAMGGNTDTAKDMSDDDLRKAIAEMAASSELVEKMEDYTKRLETKLGDTNKTNITGLFSQDGLGMSREFAESLFTETGEFNKEALEDEAKTLGYETVEEWATALGKTTTDFYYEAEKNAKNAITARTKSYAKLNKIIGKTDDEFKKIGKSAVLSAQQEEALNKKIVAVAGVSGEESAREIMSSMGTVLDSVGDKADEMASYLGAMDWRDEGAWEKLPETLKAMGITVTSEISTFIDNAKNASQAIKNIDSTNLHEQINNTYKLIDKIGGGVRSYSEEDYKQLIAANKSLEKSFMQIGDEFIYIGGSMKDLTDAVEKNTVAVLQKANSQLQDKIDMGTIVQGKASEFKSVNQMNETELQEYLMAMRYALGSSGHDLSKLGIEGLGMDTQFLEASMDDLRKWAQAIADLGINVESNKEEQANNMRKANIQVYSHNDASFNAKKAIAGGEYADEHAEALLLQAIQSGGVSNAVIEQYRGFMDQYYALMKDGKNAEAEAILKSEAFKGLTDQIVSSTDRIIESNEGRDAYQELIDRVTDAIIDARQQEIDKLSEVNDSINSAKDNLVGKLQEQINADRQARQNAETEKNISDMYSRQAYLAMDTSGGNLLEQKSLEQSLTDAEQQYQDTLVDQAIQRLQDANAVAAEQRERQIALLESQLELEQQSGRIADQASAIVASSIDSLKTGTTLDQTEMAKLLFGAEGIGNLSEMGKQSWWDAFQVEVTQAENWKFAPSNENKTGEQEGTDTTDPNLQASAREEALKNMKSAVSSFAQGKISQSAYNKAVSDARTAYTDAGGDDSKFNTALKAEADKITVNSGGTGGAASASEFSETEWDTVKVSVQTDEGTTQTIDVKVLGDYRENQPSWDGHSAIANDSLASAINNSIALDEGLDNVKPSEGWVALYKGVPYIYRKVRDYNKNGGMAWVRVDNNPKSGTSTSYSTLVGYLQQARKKRGLSEYKTGGLADFTGPAWLDGTPSRPEYVLNAAQTERFFSLIDVLENYDANRESASGGDNYFDINISVEKIEDDYDVEQMADKIRRMIYEDATYRNVNAINHIR